MEQINIEYNFTSASRSFCTECDFLKSRCLCDTLEMIPNNIHLIVLQHPSETKHPLNTVRIMKKSFQKVTVMIGEDFTLNEKLNALLSESNNSCALLYPGEDASILNTHEPHRQLTHLILLDGTWRKTKKIFLFSKNLHNISRVKLEIQTASDYRIRKAPNDQSLSTLEAAITALNFLEPDLDTAAAIASFEKMVDMQIKKMGRELYQSNYLDKKRE